MDIVKRLRKWMFEENTYELLSDAADEIERLRQQVQQYEDVAYIIDSQGVAHQSFTIVYKEVH